MSTQASTAPAPRGLSLRRSPVVTVVVAWAALFAAFALSLVVAAGFGLDMDAVTRDRVEVTQDPWETALLANVGFILWGAIAAVALFTATLPVDGPDRLRVLVLGIGVAYLAFDDALRIHEIVLPKVGVPEKVPLAVYSLLACAGFLRVVRGLDATPRTLLVLAVGCLGASVLIDQAWNPVEAVEDAFKIFGILTLLAFAVTWSQSLVLRRGS
jgi:hypothetical protein